MHLFLVTILQSQSCKFNSSVFEVTLVAVNLLVQHVFACYSLRFQFTAGLAQKQLVQRLKMPSVWFKFILPPEAMQGPDCVQSISFTEECPLGSIHILLLQKDSSILSLLEGHWRGQVDGFAILLTLLASRSQCIPGQSCVCQCVLTAR